MVRVVASPRYRWIDQLVQNTEDLTLAVGLIYGPVGARAFYQQWAQHTQFLVDYAVAVGQDNDPAADEARAHLADYAYARRASSGPQRT